MGGWGGGKATWILRLTHAQTPIRVSAIVLHNNVMRCTRNCKAVGLVVTEWWGDAGLHRPRGRPPTVAQQRSYRSWQVGVRHNRGCSG